MSDDDTRHDVNRTRQPIRETLPECDGFESQSYGENTIIFEQGAVGDAAYMIVRGQVEIRKGVLSSSPCTLAMLDKGDIFGEMALFDNRPRMAEAVTRSEVELIAIHRDEFNRRLESTDPVIRTMVRYVVGRVRAMADEFISRKDPIWRPMEKKKK